MRRVLKTSLLIGWLAPLGLGLGVFISTASQMLKYMASSGRAAWPPAVNPEMPMAPEDFALFISWPLILIGFAWLMVVVVVGAWKSTGALARRDPDKPPV